jgi:hypothetical protein
MEKLFNLGQVVVTGGVNDRVADNEDFAKFVWDSLQRHNRGDWGNLDHEDTQANTQALVDNTRLLSAYGEGEDKIWIITEADRSSTTVLFPGEY